MIIDSYRNNIAQKVNFAMNKFNHTLGKPFLKTGKQEIFRFDAGINRGSSQLSSIFT
jgi:hypothetical protein